MSKLIIVLRVLLGLVFVVFGANKFLLFLEVPPLPGPAADFLAALVATGYMIPLIGATEVVGGLAVLSGGFTPLGLVVLAPISVNILAFHLRLAPAIQDAGLGYAVFGLNVLLGILYIKNYGGLFQGRRER